MYRFTILGCGSSGGVPRLGGDWGDCDPTNRKNRRRRCSLLVERIGAEGITRVLIDTSPDLRAQMLAANVRHVDALLYTHDHADQVHGIDDLRVFAMRRRQRIPAWMDEATRDALIGRFPYIFKSQEGYPAILDEMAIPPHGQPWTVGGAGGTVPVVTFDQAHGPIRSVGYRIGPVAYSSDVSRLQYKEARTTVNVSASYQWRPWLEFSVDLMNAFNEPHTFYRALPDRISSYSRNGATLTFSVSGRF